MGNIINITNKEGELIAQVSQSLACYAYFKELAKKYKPDFNDFSGDINRELETVYNKATPEDEVVILVFINDKNKFTEKDIPSFEKAIENYPKKFNKGPRRVLTKYLELLKKYGELNTEYVSTTSSMTVFNE